MEHIAVVTAVVLLYVQIFNKVGNMYFDSDRQMTIMDLYRHFVPEGSVVIRL